MSEPIKDQPAFPTDHSGREGITDIQGGLTKREWFAAMALQGMLANPSEEGGIEGIATYAYKYADEMLKESEMQP